MGTKKDFDHGIVILGAGNVATHIALALKNNNFFVRMVYSKTAESAKILADQIKTDFTTNINELPLVADLYIISVSDSAISKLIENLKVNNGIVVHTAGSISMNLLKPYFKNFGVFYPLQTFTKSRSLDFSEIPLCIEASNTFTQNKLLSLAQSLSSRVELINSDKRKVLHMAAVFACNFTNHMYSIGSELLKSEKIDLDLLHPLIHETAKKAVELNPGDAQTGPAVRNDKKTIGMHLKMLKKYPEFEKIYSFVSESIYKLNKKTD